MLKQVFEYEDIDGEATVATAWFHLTELELRKDMELEVLQMRFEKFQREVIDDSKRDMTPAETREMFRMIEVLVKASYGVRYGPDNKRFDKDPERWKEFNDTGAYDGFMRWVFEDPTRANNWMMNIWPKQMNEAIDEARKAGGVATVTDIHGAEESAPDETSMSWQFMENVKDYSLEYLVGCSEAEFDAIVKHFSDGRNVPFELLVAGGKRMNGDQAE